MVQNSRGDLWKIIINYYKNQVKLRAFWEWIPSYFNMKTRFFMDVILLLMEEMANQPLVSLNVWPAGPH